MQAVASSSSERVFICGIMNRMEVHEMMTFKNSFSRCKRIYDIQLWITFNVRLLEYVVEYASDCCRQVQFGWTHGPTDTSLPNYIHNWLHLSGSWLMTVLAVLLLISLICDVNIYQRSGLQACVTQKQVDEPCILIPSAKWGLPWESKSSLPILTLPLSPSYCSWSPRLSTWAMIKRPGLAPQ